MSENLLNALSSVGTMGLDVFYSNFSKLTRHFPEYYETYDIKDIRSRTLRIMSALGHCDVDFDHRFISVCNPSIIALPKSGLPRMVWCGARTKFLVEKLLRIQKQHKEEIFVEILPQHMNEILSMGMHNSTFPLPDSIIIDALTEEAVKKIIPELRIQEYLPKSPVLNLLDFSVNVKEIRPNLQLAQSSEPDWKSSTFNSTQLKFGREKNNECGPSLSSYTSPITQQKIHLYWEDGKGYEIDRDWGRWLILSEHKKSVICFDKRMQILTIPATVPLPVLLARSITLCSGRCPRELKEEKMIGDIPPGHLLEAYNSVPLSVAEEVAKKLGQDLLFHEFRHQNYGE